MTDLTEQWINIYKSKRLGGYWSGAFCYKTKRAAIKNLADKEHYLTTVNIEDVLNLQAENDKLKELLKECRECVDENLEFSKSIGRNRIQPRNKGLLKRIDEVLK